MLNRWYVFIVLASFSFVTGCSLGEDSSGQTSRVLFKMPGELGVSAQSGFICYAVSITAPDMESISPGECDASYGTGTSFRGLVAPNSEIELEATMGSQRQIDLYYVLSDTNCLDIDSSVGLGQTYGSNKVYKVGEVTADFDQLEVTVPIQLQYPSNSNRLSTLINSPASCNQDITGQPVVIRQARSVQGSVVGTTANGSTMSVRVLDHKIGVNTTAGEAKIHPVRLGDVQ